jgi:putative tricarboxylic transport membrane protein
MKEMKTTIAGKRGNRPDIAFGIVLIATAVIALIEIRGLGSGTASNMGGGYVPRALSVFLLIMGLFYALRGFLLHRYVAMPAIGWKSAGLVCAAIAVFAFTLETLGLFVATLLMTIFASLANKEHRWVEMIIFAVGMSVFTVIVFILGLKLALPVWPVFIGN